LQRSRNWLGAFAALAALGTTTVLAFLCKETGALLPLFALVLNATLLADGFSQKDRTSQRLIMAGCAIPTLAIVYMLLTMGLQPNAFLHREFTVQDRLLTQLHVVFDYIKQILLPSLTGSGIYYDDYTITHSLFKPISTLLLALGLIASIVCALFYRKRYALLCFAVLWFFAGHLMESTVLPLELYYEHRNYIPMLGLMMAVTALPFYFGERKQITFLFLGIWLAMLAVISSLQAPIWGQSARLVTFWTIEHPKSLRATQELAKFYYETADPQASVDVMMIAYNNGMHSADLPLTSLLTSCWKPGVKYKNLDLLAESMKAIKTSPFSNGSLVVMQKLNQDVQNNRCPKVLNRQSWLELSKALLANPKFKRVGGSFIHVERAKLIMSAKNLPATMWEFEQAYKAQPTTEMSYKVAQVLLTAGLIDEAEIWLKKGLVLNKPLVKEMLSSDKKKSRALLTLIEQAKKQKSMNTFPVTSQKKD
jgi:protein O-mannosyl-transferase